MKSHSLMTSRRCVIKIGSALLVDDATGQIHSAWLDALLADVATLQARGIQVILVSSGAIAIGRRHLKVKRQTLLLEELQAAAAIGQIQLAHAYQTSLLSHNISVAQILLTLDDSENRKRYLNARNTLDTLLNLGVIPVINENDSIGTSEIRYGDNDRLAARVAQMAGADTLVLLSDIDGLYTQDPNKHPAARFIEEVTTIDDTILNMAGESASCYGSGGMKTKLAAAKIVMASGCRMVITSGHKADILAQGLADQKATWFIPSISPLRARKNWLAQHLKPAGKLHLDEGAISALQSGKSLLAAGVTELSGTFKKGDAVELFTPNGKAIARGLINYPAHDAKKIIGQQSSQIPSLLGYSGSDELIHRNDLVLLEVSDE